MFRADLLEIEKEKYFLKRGFHAQTMKVIWTHIK